MDSNSIRHKTEAAFVKYLGEYLKRTEGAVIVASDRADDLPDKPYVLVVANRFEELYGPGTGIFKVGVEVHFSSHVKETSSAQRDQVITAINNFTYNSPASTISAQSGFYCHGIVPTAGEMQVDGEEKSYDYIVQYDVFCMPRDNA